MGLSQSLYSGISGLKTHQTCMDNIGNNLANVNTTAFKKGVFQFRTLLEQTLRGGSAADAGTARGSINPLQVGLGTQIGGIMKNFNTGQVEVTGNARDMMIDGNGFFVLRNGNSNVLTRDGTFFIGSDGSLMYNDGMYVQGLVADKTGKIQETGSYSDVKIPIGQTGAAIETTKVSFTGNLDSNVEKSIGVKLAANSNGINMNEALSKYLGEVQDALYKTGEVDATWPALIGDAYINGGTTWTTSSFGVKDPQTGAMKPAVLTGDQATRLEELWYLSGTTWVQPFKGIDNPPTFTVSGTDQTTLTNWKFNAVGYRMLDSFNYNMTEQMIPATPPATGMVGNDKFVQEIYTNDKTFAEVKNEVLAAIAIAGDNTDVPVGARAARVAAADAAIQTAYNRLLATTAADNTHWAIMNDPDVIAAMTTASTAPNNTAFAPTATKWLNWALVGGDSTEAITAANNIAAVAATAAALGTANAASVATAAQAAAAAITTPADAAAAATAVAAAATAASTATGATPASVAAAAAQAAARYTPNGDYTPQGSDLVPFNTTQQGITFAQTKDPTITAEQARNAFNGSVKFGNQLLPGSGVLRGYTPSHIDQDIEINYIKGGRAYTTTFTYSDKHGDQSYNIEHLMKFLCGTVDSTVSADSIQSIQQQLTLPPVGGVMGTIQVAGKVSSSIDGGEYGYNVPPETAGAFTRSGITTNVAYAGAYKPTGTDSSQLTVEQMDAAGYALKSKWYYKVEAFPLAGSSPLTYEYAVTTYSDSARTTAVATSAKMLGTGDGEMKRSINLDTTAFTDQTYQYRVDETTDALGNKLYAVRIFNEAGVEVANSGGGVIPPTGTAINTNLVNITMVGKTDAVGVVNFGPDMEGATLGSILMANFAGQPAYPPAGTATGIGNLAASEQKDLPLTTTSAGINYAENNGIGNYTALSAFDSRITLGAFLSATDTNPSMGSFDSAGQSQNYSILSNLGIDNAITDISFSYNNVSYNDIWTQDTKYSAEQGGSSTTNIVVYDSLGNPKEITITMTLVERDSSFSTYRWYAESRDDTDAKWQLEETSREITSNSNVGTGTIRFDAYGQFVKGVEYSETQGIELTLKMQGVHDVLRISMVEGMSKHATQKLDFSAMTQVAAQANFNLKEQDGSAPGTLDSFTTTPEGIIQGIYSNGVVRSLARLAIALVPNETGLMSSGGNLYYTSPASGEAQIALAGVGGRGTIRGSSLETSNVDLSEEFTKLITTQRGFQANSKTITTSDEMLQELINLKR